MVHLAAQHRVCALMGGAKTLSFLKMLKTTPARTQPNTTLRWGKVHGTNRLYEYLGSRRHGRECKFRAVRSTSLQNSRFVFATLVYFSYDGQIRKCSTYLLILQVRVEEIMSRNSSSFIFVRAKP